MDKNLGHEYEKDTESRYRAEDRNPIPTPWPHVNELLQGGLGSGDVGIIFGNPGGGKSWMLTALGAMPVSLGYTVAHYTLELSEGYMGRRYDATFTGLKVQELGLHRTEVNEMIDKLKGKLIIKEFSMGKASISSIEAHIQKMTDLGTKPDLVIIDYVDLLKSKRKSTDRKDEIDDIYISTKALARDLKLPIWTVSQVNRAGAKDDVIEGDKAAGSYNKVMIADFAMSLSRKRLDKMNGTGRAHIMKNRYGGDGMTYPVKINTENGNIEILDREMEEGEFAVENGNQGPKAPTTSFSAEERNYLQQRFFELGK